MFALQASDAMSSSLGRIPSLPAPPVQSASGFGDSCQRGWPFLSSPNLPHDLSHHCSNQQPHRTPQSREKGFVLCVANASVVSSLLSLCHSVSQETLLPSARNPDAVKSPTPER